MGLQQHTGPITNWTQKLDVQKQSALGNKEHDFFEKDKDKDNILVDNILAILLEDIFRQLILQRIRIKDILRIFKDQDKDTDFWVICEFYAGSRIFRLF